MHYIYECSTIILCIIVCVSVPVCIVCVVVHEVQFVGFAVDSNVSVNFKTSCLLTHVLVS